MVHDFQCRYAVTTPGRDPDYVNPGMRIYVHSAIGFYPERKVRVAWAIQIGKHILSEENGVLCFYATTGFNPNTAKNLMEKGLEYPVDVVTYNDG